MPDADELRNKLLVNEFSFLRDQTMPTVSAIQKSVMERFGRVKAVVRFKLSVRFK